MLAIKIKISANLSLVRLNRTAGGGNTTDLLPMAMMTCQLYF
ncbi:MAG: hypothetical protein PHH14_06775 [Candidatus Margulisbacteria bacterium]|nr:hypothetical protein [Candidatus Margulisiibacteriota bacterium]